MGFRTEGSIRGLHPSGLEERLVKQEKDFDGIDSKKHIVRFSHQLGEKKRLLFLEKARQLKVKIANPGTMEPAARPDEEALPEREPNVGSETNGVEQPNVESASIVEEETNSAAEDDTETRTISAKEESEEESNK